MNKQKHLWTLIFLLTLLPATIFSQNWMPLDNGLPRYVRSMYAYGGNLIVGTAGGTGSHNTWLWDGIKWDTLMIPNLELSASLNSMVTYQGDLVIVTDYGDILKWTGNNWVNIGGYQTKLVYGIYPYGNDLYAYGWFDSIGGIPASRIAKWDGTNWSAIDTTIWDGGILSDVIVYQGDLYIGGGIYNYNGSISKN